MDRKEIWAHAERMRRVLLGAGQAGCALLFALEGVKERGGRGFSWVGGGQSGPGGGNEAGPGPECGVASQRILEPRNAPRCILAESRA